MHIPTVRTLNLLFSHLLTSTWRYSIWVWGGRGCFIFSWSSTRDRRRLVFTLYLWSPMVWREMVVLSILICVPAFTTTSYSHILLTDSPVRPALMFLSRHRLLRFSDKLSLRHTPSNVFSFIKHKPNIAEITILHYYLCFCIFSTFFHITEIVKVFFYIVVWFLSFSLRKKCCELIAGSHAR